MARTAKDWFIHWIYEREAIRLKKEAGQPKPWTQDPILDQYKFCNVFRKDDRCTRWVHNNWSLPNQSDPDLWFALVIARRALNCTPSMEYLGYPCPWDSSHFIAKMKERVAKGLKCYDTAYQLLVQGKTGDKSENMVQYILDPLWNDRENLRPKKSDTLREFFNRLSAHKYMGLFYSGQVVADLKYVQLTDAPDWNTFVVSGPGSRRGLNRLLGRDVNAPWTEKTWQEEFKKVFDWVNSDILAIPGQDLQNDLCEYDKYIRIMNSEGKVRPYKPFTPQD